MITKKPQELKPSIDLPEEEDNTVSLPVAFPAVLPGQLVL